MAQGRFELIGASTAGANNYMVKSIVIRQSQSGDGVLYRALRIAALSDAPYAFGARLADELARPPAEFEADAVRHSSSETSTSFIAFSGEEPIGMVGAYFEASTGRAFICSLWLSPEFRGGTAGAEIVRTALNWLGYRGSQEGFAWVADANLRAVKFYSKLGFVNTGESQPLPTDLDTLEHLYRCTVTPPEDCRDRT